MRVCLVGPSVAAGYGEAEISLSPDYKIYASQPQLGILSVAAAAESYGLVPSIVDASRLYYEYLHDSPGGDFAAFAAERIANIDATLYGFGTVCNTYPLTLRIVRELKRLRPESVILLGGPQASVVDEQTLVAFPEVDFVLRGEADLSFVAMLQALSGSGSYAQVPGLTYRIGNTPWRNPAAAPVEDLDALPLPSYHLHADMDARASIPLEIGRGCPFACRFCSTNDFFRRRFRLKSPATTLSQMTALAERYGTNRFNLVHDMFTVDRKRVVAFCETMIEARTPFRWGCSARTDCVDAELLELMYRAGCHGLFFGIETGSQRMQTVIDKHLDIAEAMRIVETCERQNFNITVALITGFPEEERDDLEDTMQFLVKSVRHDGVDPQMNMLAPLAGTPVYENHKHELTLDPIISRISHLGWQIGTADRELIAAFPRLFPDFYAPPTRLERRYIESARLFFIYGAIHVRWVLAALRRISPKLMDVHDEWSAWRSNPTLDPRYFGAVDFVDDLLRFVSERYEGALKAEGLEAVLPFERATFDARLRLHYGHAQGQERSAVSLAQNVEAFELDSPIVPLLDALRTDRPAPPREARRCVVTVRLFPSGRFEVAEHPQIGSMLLSLVLRGLSASDIDQEFAASVPPIRGIPPDAVARVSIRELAARGYLQVVGR